MSKIDWAVAEATYITKSDTSYDTLASLFGTAKTTIVRHARKRDWQAKKERYTERRIDELQRRTLETRVQAEERELKTLRLTQTLFHNQVIRLLRKQRNNEEVTRKEWRSVAEGTSAMIKAIFAERIILGLRTKKVLVRDKDDISAYQLIMNHSEESPREEYENFNDSVKDLEKLLDHLKRHELYRADFKPKSRGYYID